MGSTTRGMLARALRHGSVRDDAWPDAADRSGVGSVRPGHPAGDPPSRPVADECRGWQRRRPAERARRRQALIIWGERDPWYPPALADAYAARLPGARIERLSDAGHWPWLDRSDLVERVADFLEE